MAYRLVYPFRTSDLSPNHLTTLRLIFGLLACLGLASGEWFWTNVGAFCFCLSSFLDHADGEFARLTGQMSEAGHLYDLASDFIINIFLFVGIGIGLRDSALGLLSVPMGAVAGIAVAVIFYLRQDIESQAGVTDSKQPAIGIFEVEDVLYLLPVVTLSGMLIPFLVLATIGTPLFAVWVYRYTVNKKVRTGNRPAD